MGRKTTAEAPRTAQLRVMFSPAEREAIEGQAERDGKLMSVWARETLLAAVSPPEPKPAKAKVRKPKT